MNLLLEITDVVSKRFIYPILASIRLETSALLFKTLIGAIISSVLIYSTLKMIDYYMNWFASINGESLLPLYIFGTIVVLCLLGLFFLFKKSKEVIASEQERSEDTLSLVVFFTQGFSEGFVSKRNSQDLK